MGQDLEGQRWLVVLCHSTGEKAFNQDRAEDSSGEEAAGVSVITLYLLDPA
jgi:hypothetical protein